MIDENTPAETQVPDLSNMTMEQMILATTKAAAESEATPPETTEPTPEPETETADETTTEETATDETENEADSEQATNDEAETESEADTDEPESDGAVYEIMGKQYTEDELVELTRAGLRNEDYTQKTQALAAQRNELEQEKKDLGAKLLEATKEQQEAYIKSIDELAKLKQVFFPKKKTADELAKLSVTDPTTYNQYMAVTDAIERGMKDVDSIFQMQDQVSAQEQQKYIQSQEEILKKQDEWKDLSTVYPKFIANLETAGIPKEVGGGILDANVIMLLNDGLKYRNGKANAEKNVKEKKAGVRIIKKAVNKAKPIPTAKSNVAKATEREVRTTNDLISVIQQIANKN